MHKRSYGKQFVIVAILVVITAVITVVGLSRIRWMAAPASTQAGHVDGLLAIELVKDRRTKEPFEEAGNFVYRHAFRHGVAWATAGSILRITPPIVMSTEVFAKGLEIVDEAIAAAEKEFGVS